MRRCFYSLLLGGGVVAGVCALAASIALCVVDPVPTYYQIIRFGKDAIVVINATSDGTRISFESNAPVFYTVVVPIPISGRPIMLLLALVSASAVGILARLLIHLYCAKNGKVPQ